MFCLLEGAAPVDVDLGATRTAIWRGVRHVELWCPVQGYALRVTELRATLPLLVRLFSIL
jgi:hypothetical protein